MPGDRLALAVGVGRQVDRARRPCTLLFRSLTTCVLSFGDEVLRREVMLHVNAECALRADRGHAPSRPGRDSRGPRYFAIVRAFDGDSTMTRFPLSPYRPRRSRAARDAGGFGRRRRLLRGRRLFRPTGGRAFRRAGRPPGHGLPWLPFILFGHRTIPFNRSRGTTPREQLIIRYGKQASHPCAPPCL